MKNYVVVNNREELNKILKIYKHKGWTPSVKGVERLDSKSYPITIGYFDNYGWYKNAGHEDLGASLTVDDVVAMSREIDYVFYAVEPNREDEHFLSKFSNHLKGVEKEEFKSHHSHISSVKFANYNGLNNYSPYSQVDCKVVSVEKFYSPLALTYTDNRLLRHLGFWKIKVKLACFLEINDHNHRSHQLRVVTNLQGHNKADLELQVKPSNYLYYTLFV